MVHQLSLLEMRFMFPDSLLPAKSKSCFHVPRAAHVLKHWRVCRHAANLSKLQSSSKLERTCLKALLCMAACQKFGVEDCKLVSLGRFTNLGPLFAAFGGIRHIYSRFQYCRWSNSDSYPLHEGAPYTDSLNFAVILRLKVSKVGKGCVPQHW